MGERPDPVGWDDQSGERDRETLIIRETEVTAIPGADEETVELREDIEQTRAEMSETITAITERLSPDHIKEQVKEQVREQVQEAKETVRDATIGKAEDMVRSAGETVNEARYTVMETIRANPIPAALIGIGLGWLYMNRRSAPAGGARSYQYRGDYYAPARYEERGGYYGGTTRYQERGGYGGEYGREYEGQSTLRDTAGRVQEGASSAASRVTEGASSVASQARDTAGQVAGQVQQTAGQVAGQVQQTAGQVVDQVQQTAGQVVDRAQYQAQRLEDRFQRTLRENPFAVGAAALALGVGVGLVVPETRTEAEFMGEARDRLVDKASTAAQDTFEKVQQVASRVADEAGQTAREEAQSQGLTSQS